MTRYETEYNRWLREVAANCTDAINVRGGAWCKTDPKTRKYCDMSVCPKWDGI